MSRILILSVCCLFLVGCYIQYVDDDLFLGYGVCSDRDGLRSEFLLAINQARSRGRYCGDRYYPPASPVAWNSRLGAAAEQHAGDMADYDYLNPLSPDGTGLEQRLDEANYPASQAGENLGGGYPQPDDVVDAWLNDPRECANLMSGAFLEIGAACAGRDNTQYGIYWSLVLAGN